MKEKESRECVTGSMNELFVSMNELFFFSMNELFFFCSLFLSLSQRVRDRFDEYRERERERESERARARARARE